MQFVWLSVIVITIIAVFWNLGILRILQIKHLEICLTILPFHKSCNGCFVGNTVAVVLCSILPSVTSRLSCSDIAASLNNSEGELTFAKKIQILKYILYFISVGCKWTSLLRNHTILRFPMSQMGLIIGIGLRVSATKRATPICQGFSKINNYISFDWFNKRS